MCLLGLNSNSRISIHAPREGGDVFMAALLSSLGISIHAPREGGDSPHVIIRYT